MSDFDSNIEYDNPDPQEEGGEESELSDYGKRFVEQAPENEREFARKYVSQWDAGYKKQVERYETELGEYRQLGAKDDVQAGSRLYQMLVNNPERVLHYLTDDPKGPKLTPRQAAAAVQSAQDNEGPTGQTKKSDPHTERLDKIETALLAMARRSEETQTKAQQEADQRAFVSAIGEAKTKHGDFDDKYVAYLLATGQAQTIDEAVKQFHKTVGRPSPGRRAPAPNLLGANSAAPSSNNRKTDWGKASDKDVKDFLVHALEAGNE